MIITDSDYASLSAAITAAGSNETSIRITQAHTLSADLTVPANVELYFVGGTISVSATFTLTINGFVRGKTYRWFSGAGSVSFGRVFELIVDWFGDNSTRATAAAGMINDAISAALSGSIIRFLSETYGIESQITLPQSKKLTFDLNGATLQCQSGLSTNSAFRFAGSANAANIWEFKNGVAENDAIASPGYFLDITNGQRIRIENVIFDGHHKTAIYCRTTDDITVTRCKFLDSIETRVIDVNQCDNVTIDFNFFQDVLTAASIEAASDYSRYTSFSHNFIKNTADTALFMRAVTTTAKDKTETIISNNIVVDAGKSALKLEVPASSSGTIQVYNAQITGNLVKGFATDISSYGIGVIRDASDTDVIIKGVVVANNIVDGKGSSGTTTSFGEGSWGFYFGFLEDAVVSGNVARNTYNAGFYFYACTDVQAINNVAVACNSSETSTAVGGTVFQSSSRLTISGESNETVNGPGYWFDKMKHVTIDVQAHSNNTYGLEFSNAGDSNSRNQNITYRYVTTGNTSGNVSQTSISGSVVRSPLSIVETYGIINAGDSTKRDNIDDEFSSSDTGFMFFNTTTGKPNWYKSGTGWVDAAGTAV